jgi:hypothetical protein
MILGVCWYLGPGSSLARRQIGALRSRWSEGIAVLQAGRNNVKAYRAPRLGVSVHCDGSWAWAGLF